MFPRGGMFLRSSNIPPQQAATTENAFENDRVRNPDFSSRQTTHACIRESKETRLRDGNTLGF